MTAPTDLYETVREGRLLFLGDGLLTLARQEGWAADNLVVEAGHALHDASEVIATLQQRETELRGLVEKWRASVQAWEDSGGRTELSGGECDGLTLCADALERILNGETDD